MALSYLRAVIIHRLKAISNCQLCNAVKSRHNNARETAKVLAAAYLSNTTVDTIVCMEETEVIGTFLAEQLADQNQY